jgi:hypothetical protein
LGPVAMRECVRACRSCLLANTQSTDVPFHQIAMLCSYLPSSPFGLMAVKTRNARSRACPCCLPRTSRCEMAVGSGSMHAQQLLDRMGSKHSFFRCVSQKLLEGRGGLRGRVYGYIRVS